MEHNNPKRKRYKKMFDQDETVNATFHCSSTSIFKDTMIGFVMSPTKANSSHANYELIS